MIVHYFITTNFTFAFLASVLTCAKYSPAGLQKDFTLPFFRVP